MKYMLMMHAPLVCRDWEIMRWPPEDIKAHHTFMLQLYKELSESGELVIAEGLAAPQEAKLVCATPSGEPNVSDGPWPENREFLRGFWIVEVDRPERAFEIAGRASAAPGLGGSPMRLQIEVRQVLAPPSAGA